VKQTFEKVVDPSFQPPIATINFTDGFLFFNATKLANPPVIRIKD